MTTVLVGYGRMPADPPGGLMWVEVWRDYALDAVPLETARLGWRKDPAEMAAAYAEWMKTRPDLADATVLIAGGNARELSRVITETYVRKEPAE